MVENREQTKAEFSLIKKSGYKIKNCLNTTSLRCTKPGDQCSVRSKCGSLRIKIDKLRKESGGVKI